jgi:type I restriction enzyme M protein
MGNAGRNGGEYYTPRPLIRAMAQVVQPRIGERMVIVFSALADVAGRSEEPVFVSRCSA